MRGLCGDLSSPAALAQGERGEALLAILHADTPLRVWSLIVTIFGDIVMRRGTEAAPGPIWVAPLLDLLENLGVEASPARTSLSRLVAGGVLAREKVGRNTFYRLTPASAAEFVEAAEIIYGRRVPTPAKRFHLAAIDRCADRPGARSALQNRGFRFFASTMALAPARGGIAPPPGALIGEVAADGEAVALARELWKIDALQANYADFVAAFAPFAGAAFSPQEAAIARVVAVHRFRRLALRDPGLPEAALPADWAGAAARAAFVALLAAAEAPSEAWLGEQRFREGVAD